MDIAEAQTLLENMRIDSLIFKGHCKERAEERELSYYELQTAVIQGQVIKIQEVKPNEIIVRIQCEDKDQKKFEMAAALLINENKVKCISVF